LAPITPFASEYLYQLCRVDGDAESSHLCAWPKHNASSVKKNLEQDMEIARKVVEAGHSLRSENSLRVRQPLASIFIEHKFSQNQEEYEKIISDELNVEKFAKNIVEISDPVQNDSKEVKVVLDKKLDDRLISLGDIRDVLRAIQQLRKKIGLKAGDLARLEYDGELGAVELVTKNQELIKKQTAVQNVSKAPKDESFVEIKTSKGSIFISISETSSDSN
jgi:isoleucyl-tRNA synthetase